VLLAAAVFVAQMVAKGTTGGAAQAGTYGRTGLAAYCTAQQRAASRTQATADGSFGAVALACTDSTAGRAANAGANGRASLAAKLLTNNVAQDTTQAAANGGSTVTGESALAQQQAEGKGRQSQTHDTNLKGIIRISCRATGGGSGLKRRFSGSSGHRGIADCHHRHRRGHADGGGDGHGRGHASHRHRRGSDGCGNLRSAGQRQPAKGLQDGCSRYRSLIRIGLWDTS